MEKTINYQLNQWAAGDKVQRVDFNADNAKLDAALKANADAITAEVSARDKAVAAEVSARTAAVSAEVSARTAAVAALEDKTKLHTIKTMTFSRTTSNVAISLKGIDWGQWKVVATVIHADMDSGTCRLYPSGSTQDTSILSYSNDFLIIQFPLHQSGLPFSGIILADSSKVFSFGVSFRTAQGFSLSPLSTQTLLGGSATIYGMK